MALPHWMWFLLKNTCKCFSFSPSPSLCVSISPPFFSCSMLKHFQKKKRPGHAASLPQKANCRLTYQLETTGSTGGRKASIQWASWPSVSHTDTGWLSGDRPRARLPCLVVLNQTGRLKLSRYVCTGLLGMRGYREVTSQ